MEAVMPSKPGALGPIDVSRSPAAKWRTLPLNAVRLESGTLADFQKLSSSASIWHGLKMLEEAGNLGNLRAVARGGEYRGPVFMDSDVYKWVEAASFDLAREPSPALDEAVEKVTAVIAAAQASDGYINSYYTVAKPGQRWTDLPIGHELYCAGHLFQAAVARNRGADTKALLGIATAFADHIDARFGPGREEGICGHPEIETALVELYRLTGQASYLELAKTFVQRRGHGLLGRGRFRDPQYFQDHEPVVDSHEIVGHSVRSTYLNAGVTDLYLETGDQALLTAMLDQWQDMVTRKAYVTGALGSRHYWEGFGFPYELPNVAGYGETCAAIGSLMWGWRLLLATGEGRFADAMERALYNSILSGISLDGRSFFYENPLSSEGASRQPWYEVACCPPNLMRLLATASQLFVTVAGSVLRIEQFGSCSIDGELEGAGRVRLRMETEYPWDPNIVVRVVEAPERWTLQIRIPEWCTRPSLRVNGSDWSGDVVDGHVSFDRRWAAGDTVELELAMPAEFVEANPAIDSDRDSFAIRRGPIVYCLEQADQQAGVAVAAARLPSGARLDLGPKAAGLRGNTISFDGQVADLSTWQGTAYRTYAGDTPITPARLVGIPYFLWANRTPGPMRVWIPRSHEPVNEGADR